MTARRSWTPAASMSSAMRHMACFLLVSLSSNLPDAAQVSIHTLSFTCISSARRMMKQRAAIAVLASRHMICSHWYLP